MMRSKTRTLIAGVTAGLWLGLALPAQAQMRSGDVVDITPLDLRADDTAQVVSLPRGKARIVRLPADARDVLLAEPGIADIVIKTPRLAYLLGRGVGATNAFFFDEEGKEIARLEIQVEIDTLAAQQAIEQLVPSADVKLTAVQNSFFLTGSVRNAEIAENTRQIAAQFLPANGNLVNLLTIAEDQQVLLQVRIAETTRSILKDIGVDLNAATASGDVAFNLGTGPQTGGSFLNLAGTLAGENGSITAALSALEGQGLVNTLAEPNLTAMSGEAASFLSGGEFAVERVVDEQVVTEFKEFGVRLSFTPVVLNSGRISLQIEAEVSAIANISTGSLTVQRAITTVEMPSGGSLVVGGLLQHTLTTKIRGTPGLKDVPVFGSLFRENELGRTDTELVFAVTAYLVKPVDANKLRDPTGLVAPPTDFELYFLGHLESIYGDKEAGEEVAATVLKGPIGYIVQ